MNSLCKFLLIVVLAFQMCKESHSKVQQKFLEDIDEEVLSNQANDILLSQKLAEFLQDNLKTGEIKIDLNCSSNPKISNTKAKANPPTIVKGKTANIKVQSKSTSEAKVRKLKIACELNGEKVYEQKVDKSLDLTPGQVFVYDYDASVPTFVPEGHFAVKLILLNEVDEELSCLSASFDF